MNMDKFREELNFNIDVNFLNDLLNRISNVTFSEDVNVLFSNLSRLYNYNIEKTAVNIADFKYFIDKILARDFDKFHKTGITGKEILKEDGIEIEYSTIVNEDNIGKKYDHSLYLNVDGENTINILKSLYNIIMFRGIDCKIVIPKYIDLGNGSKKQITVKCATEELEHVLKAIYSLKSFYKSKINEPNEFISKVDFIGYEYKNTSELIGKLIYRALMQSIKVWALNNSDKTLVNDESLVQTLESENTVYNLQRVIMFIVEHDKGFINRFYDYLKTEFEYEKININNPYMHPELINELDRVYGEYRKSFVEEPILETNPLKEKYAGVIFDYEKLDEEIYISDEETVWLIDLLEQNETLDLIPLDSTVYLNEGTFISGIDFINEFVIKSLEYFPDLTVEQIIDKYVSNIEIKKSKGKK